MKTAKQIKHLLRYEEAVEDWQEVLIKWALEIIDECANKAHLDFTKAESGDYEVDKNSILKLKKEL